MFELVVYPGNAPRLGFPYAAAIAPGLRRTQVSMHKVVALVEDGFALVAGEGVAEAVAEVEVGGMAAAFAVVAIGLAGDARLMGGNGLDDHP